MKRWVRQHPYRAMAFGYLLFFVLATAGWTVIGRRGLADSAITALVWTLGYYLLAVFGIRRTRRTRARLEENGQIRVYIRYTDARTGSLSSIWNQGIATPGAGSIHFQPAVYDTLEPSGRPTMIKVHDLLPERRNVSGKDHKYIQIFGVQAMTLLTDDGVVEIAAPPESLDKLSEVLGH